MGKKSVADSSLKKSAFGDAPTEVRAVRPLYSVEDLKALVNMLTTGQQTKQKQALNMSVHCCCCPSCCSYSTLQLIIFPSI